MKSVNPYLNFPGNTEEAFNFYKSVFGGEFVGIVRFRDMGGEAMGIAESELDKIAHIALPLGKDNLLMGTDVVASMPETLTMGNNFYIMLEPDSAGEADALFDALAAGGRVEMALQRTQWAEKYGTCADSFGVQWMINYTGDAEFSLGSG